MLADDEVAYRLAVRSAMAYIEQAPREFSVNSMSVHASYGLGLARAGEIIAEEVKAHGGPRVLAMVKLNGLVACQRCTPVGG